MKQGIKRIKVTPAERKTIVNLYAGGAGNINEIARAMKRPKSTVYNIIQRSGVWERTRKKRTVPAKPAPKVEIPKPTLVPSGSIELIAVRRRSLWQRIKDFFA